MTSAGTDTALWYLGRATGVVSLVLFTIAVALGIATRSGRPLPGLPRFAVSMVHRSASLLAVIFLVVHVVTLTLDPQSQLRWIDAVLPFGSSFKPLWTALGALALDLVAAVMITSWLRQRIGYRLWRLVHWAAYAMWPFALLHTLGSGTDVRQPWLAALLFACVTGVLALLGWRTSTSFLDDSDRARGTKLPSREHRPLAATRGPR
jgi:sulfoxide reductase heme-binding subunit YedZ